MLAALRAAARPQAMAVRHLSASATVASSELRARLAELIPDFQVRNRNARTEAAGKREREREANNIDASVCQMALSG